MTPDELRALADALEPMARAPRFEDFDVPAFCAWVRAQADAQPVAWIARNLTTGRVKWTTDRCRARGWTRDANLRVKLLYAHPAPAVPAGWQLVPVEPTPEMLQAGASIMDFDRSGWYDADVSRGEYRAMLAAAPTAPQAEQPIDLDAVAMQQMRQAAAESTWMPSEYTSNDWIADVCRWLRDGPPAAAPQAEPSAALIRAYNSGYMQGHHDTVEAQFIVIHPLDMDTYHADVVAELGLTAAPQAEPCIGNDPLCPCQDGDACHYKDAADGTKAWPVPQAEPKREPLTARRILEIEDDAIRQWRDNGMIDDPAVVFARMIERAHGIGGSDAE